MYRLAHYQSLWRQVLQGLQKQTKNDAECLNVFHTFTCMVKPGQGGSKNIHGIGINPNMNVFQPTKFRKMCNIGLPDL